MVTRWMPRIVGAEPGSAVELRRMTVAPSPTSLASQEPVQPAKPIRLVKRRREPRHDSVDEGETRD
jgi:hypothetical protein